MAYPSAMNSELTLGRRLRQLRKAKRLDQRELATRVDAQIRAEGGRGFDFTYLSKIENDRVDPPSEAVLRHLAAELDAEYDEILTLSGRVPSDLGKTLQKSPAARTFYRSAQSLNLSEDDWLALAEELRRRKDER